MKNGYRSILLLLIALIVAGGVLLFVLRDQLLDVLRAQTGVNELMFPGERAVSPASSVLDVGMLDSPTFVSLQSNVSKFDFDNICKQSGSVKAPVSVIVDDDDSEAVVKKTTNCVLGNNDPFFIKNKN